MNETKIELTNNELMLIQFAAMLQANTFLQTPLRWPECFADAAVRMYAARSTLKEFAQTKWTFVADSEGQATPIPYFVRLDGMTLVLGAPAPSQDHEA